MRELARNYMSGSSPGNECREVFTTRQIQKMRYVLFTRRPELLEKEPIQLSNIIDGNE
ncbi:MAG: hypothetical protein GWN14_10000 [candidate division Zixibacteria bacterium]|nr:hypothetical protein [Gammaproteobacteria bacterium]NIX56238.1 hypothetical protein [candidate division Zixibacteria bacterium]